MKCTGQEKNLGYYEHATIADVKSFITLGPSLTDLVFGEFYIS